jgi:hypothetical protein
MVPAKDRLAERPHRRAEPVGALGAHSGRGPGTVPPGRCEEARERQPDRLPARR